MQVFLFRNTESSLKPSWGHFLLGLIVLRCICPRFLCPEKFMHTHTHLRAHVRHSFISCGIYYLYISGFIFVRSFLFGDLNLRDGQPVLISASVRKTTQRFFFSLQHFKGHEEPEDTKTTCSSSEQTVCTAVSFTHEYLKEQTQPDFTGL